MFLKIEHIQGGYISLNSLRVMEKIDFRTGKGNEVIKKLCKLKNGVEIGEGG